MKLKGLLEEFKVIPICHYEDMVLHRIYDCVPVKLDCPGFEAPHFKMFVLLQVHFSHTQLPANLTADQVIVLEMVLNMLSACVVSSMDLSQMCVQSMWEMDSPLKQSPHFTMEVINCCKEAGIESVYDTMEMEDDRWNALLQMDMHDVAIFVNSYLTLDVSHELVKGEYMAGTPILMHRAPDDDQTVVTPFYPLKKMVSWWLVIGEPSMCQLHVIKCVTVSKDLHMKLKFSLPKGTHSLKLYVICDLYVGADHNLSVEPIDIAEGEESDSDEDTSDKDMEE
ncbi:Sec63 domain-containing protein [Pisolithus marmoratus]|nr:Sec63 domain-containing protein [Pisolithus marmoratus]